MPNLRSSVSVIICLSLLLQLLPPSNNLINLAQASEKALAYEQLPGNYDDPEFSFETTKQLPTVAERLGLKPGPGTEPKFIPITKELQSGMLRRDGTYLPPKNYSENPDAKPLELTKQPYLEKIVKSKRAIQTEVSGSITTNTTWAIGGSPYIVTANIVIYAPAILTIEPGVIVKFQPNTSLSAYYNATLNATGTSAAPIIFTSIKDDSVAGDSNNDGDQTQPTAGDWGTLGIEGWNSGTAITPAYGSLNFAQIRYGTRLSVCFSKPSISDSTITYMTGDGLYLDTPAAGAYTIERLNISYAPRLINLYSVPSSVTIKDSILRHSSFMGVIAANNSAARLTNNSIDLNSEPGFYAAIKTYGSPLVLRYNSIALNRRADGNSRGIDAGGSTVDARENWWGSVSGPEVNGQAETGGGSWITTNVTYGNWLGKTYEAEHKQGNYPWSIKEGYGVDVSNGNVLVQQTDLEIATIRFPL